MIYFKNCYFTVSQQAIQGISQYSIKLSADKFRQSPMSIKQNLTLLAFIVISIYSQSCDSGSYFDGSHCASCDFRCTVCSSSNFCTVCQTQAYLTIVEGGLICKLCNQLIPGCAICQTQNSCSVCLQGYDLLDDKCVEHDLGGGQVTISNQVTCQSFQINLNGVCRPSIALCKDYSPDGTCSACQDNTLLIQGYCIPSNIASQANSGQQNQNSDIVCQSRQYISNGECVTIGEECEQFLLNGSCTKCKTGYLVYNGLCLQQPSDNSKIVVSYIPKNQDSSQNHLSTQPQVKSPVPSETVQSQSSPISQCHLPCETCTQDPQHCLTCENGSTTVDQMPGKCFKY